MCLIVGDDGNVYGVTYVPRVSGTCIFIRSTGAERQIIVYSLSIRTATRAALVLPVPVPPEPAEDAVRFINLEGYPDFFEDLASALKVVGLGLDDSVADASAAAPLRVHRVGSFDATFVPSHAHWHRIDPRFHLPETVWRELPTYVDYGFVVFQLRATVASDGAETTDRIHPMAFEFPRRDPGVLFFPTVHVHDRKFHAQAHFDHALFCQATPEEEARIVPPPPSLPPNPTMQDILEWKNAKASGDWDASYSTAEHFVDIEKAAGCVLADRRLFHRSVWGPQLNADILI